MLHRIQEYDKYVEITGFRQVQFAQAEDFLKTNRRDGGLGVDLQFFDADLVASQRHLYFAALNGLQAFRDGRNISKSLAVEVMLYASAQRQIQRAIERCGIKPQTANMATVVVGENPVEIKAAVDAVGRCVGSTADDSVLEVTAAKRGLIMEAFSIKPQEIDAVLRGGDVDEAVINLVVERVALLATQL